LLKGGGTYGQTPCEALSRALCGSYT
jgi:hypothetical protein